MGELIEPTTVSIGKKRLTYDIYRIFKDRPIGKLYNKFNINNFYMKNNIKKSALVFKKIPATSFVGIRSFVIFSTIYLKNKMGGRPYDEVYINEHEDLDLSFRIFLNRARIFGINYRIGSETGSSLGMTSARGFRQVCGRAYFNYKYEKILDYLQQKRLLLR